MLQVELLDVDPRRAERLRDPRQDARPVGDVHAEPLEGPGVAVRLGEQPPAVPRGLGDPAGQEAAVPRGERALELLDPPAMLPERAEHGLAIREEDVDPDAWVRARDAGHVP